MLENDPLRYKPCTHFGGAISAGLKINYACDINKERLEIFSKTANIPEQNRYINYQDLLINCKPRMIIISTWTESHDTICIDAVRHGAKIVVLEKPIASSLEKSKKIVDECAGKKYQ